MFLGHGLALGVNTNPASHPVHTFGNSDIGFDALHLSGEELQIVHLFYQLSLLILKPQKFAFQEGAITLGIIQLLIGLSDFRVEIGNLHFQRAFLLIERVVLGLQSRNQFNALLGLVGHLGLEFFQFRGLGLEVCSRFRQLFLGLHLGRVHFLQLGFHNTQILSVLQIQCIYFSGLLG